MNDLLKQVLPETEVAPLDILRVDTALSRYPIHQLAKKGTISINIRKQDEKGATTLLWEVTYNSKYGQPGPLAYKLDTLIINRRIDEAGRPVPKLLKLGSLREIAEELGHNQSGENTTGIKTALRQNASAFITAKIAYQLAEKTVEKTERTLEADFTRYSIVFTGEHLPDGRKADCVYLVLNDIYAEVLNTAKRRPLDYDYLSSLAPGPQRFYEIVSYQMLPAIKYNQRAKLPYSEFCLYSTMTRYETFDQVKKQMYKIHQPHIASGYIAKVEYEATVDENGRPDWNMFYLPGDTAKRQQLVFDFHLPYIRRERGKTTPPAKKPKLSATLSEPPILPLLAIAIPENLPGTDPATLLVRRFYKLRYGAEQEPTERERGEASGYLTESEAWATHLIEFAAKMGKEANGFPNDFGGIKKLSSQAREPFEAKRKEREQSQLKKARQSHQEAHREAYVVFIGELLGGRLETSLPEAFQLFKEQEDSTYRFHKNRAGKSGMSERIIEGYYQEEERIKRLMKFIEENPKSGIPNFWQWDEKMNSNPFKPLT